MTVSRLLALDLGEKRIGVARSDALGWTAQPCETLIRVGPKKDLIAIARLVREHEIDEIIIGLPLTLEGEEGPSAQSARAFSEQLAAHLGEATPITLWDERLTTVQAERVMIAGGARRSRRKEKIDSLAAVLILQNVLDARGAGGTSAID